MPYDAFISYSHAADAHFAPALQAALHRFAKPWWKLRAVNVFRDETGLAASSDLTGAIKSALEEARFFILLASPRAAASPWVGREVMLWRQLKPSEAILIALTDGLIAWSEPAKDFDWQRTDALPAALAGAFPAEPLWVDLSWTRGRDQLSPKDPRFQQCVARIAARLHGRSLDEIFGEEVRQHRLTQLVARGAVALLAVLALAASLGAWLGYSGQKRAEHNLNEALIAVDRTQTAVANDLDELAGVPTSLRFKLLDAVQNVLNDLGTENQSDEVQHTRASLLLTVAESLASAGEFDSAAERVQQALKILTKLVATHPHDPSILWDLALAYSRAGDMSSFHSQAAPAIAAYQKSDEELARLDAEKLSNEVKGNWEYLTFRNSILVGDVYDGADGSGTICHPVAECRSQAEAYYSRALATARAAQLRDSENAKRLDTAVVQERFGDLYEETGDYAKAEAALSDALDTSKKALAAKIDDTRLRRNISAMSREIGDVQAKQCKLNAALASYQGALDAALPLYRIDPQRADWMDQIATDYQSLAQALTSLGRADAARAAYEASIKWRRAAIAKDPSKPDWQTNLSELSSALTAMQSQSGTTSPAACTASSAKNR